MISPFIESLTTFAEYRRQYKFC